VKHRSHLERLATQAGYDIDWDQMPIAVAHAPEEVGAWIAAACDLASAEAYTAELDAAQQSLRDVIPGNGRDPAVDHATQMNIVRRAGSRTRMAAVRSRTQFDTLCAALANSRLGLLTATATRPQDQ
jgi:hypothetical protein